MEFDLWQPLAGLALFLFSMGLIESALQVVSGKPFRLFIRHHTDNPLQGVLSGTAATAVLQSSSLVGLLMLALVGAGVVEMRNALSVIFGANLGTTVTGWIVATIGFKLELGEFGLPFIAVGGLGAIAFSRHRWRHYARIVLGVGLLLMGLELMKTSVTDVAESFDLGSLGSYGPLQFLVFGLLFSAIVQSSSATMMVTLSALHAGLLELPAAAAVAIGADLGTTSTVLIGAIKGGAAQRRVAVGHFGFNLVTGIIAFSLITPLLAAIALVGIQDPLLALVAFHSLFNLLGIALFLPFIRHFANLLERHFGDTDTTVNRHLGSATVDVPEATLEALELECAHLLQRVVRENSYVFQPPVRISRGMLPVGKVELEAWPLETEFGEAYQTTKALEGEILAFAIDAQSTELDSEQSDRIACLQRTVREAVHSSKSLKDIMGDLHNFDASPLTVIATYHQRFKDVFTEFYLTLYAVRHSEDRLPDLDDLIALAALAHRSHDEMHHAIYADVRRDRLSELDISSLLNTNRGLFNSNRSLIAAMAAFVLTVEQLEVFESLPDTVA